MKKKSSRIVSLITAVAVMFVTSSGNIKTVADEIKVIAADSVQTGDVNGNGSINIFDLIRIQKEITDPKEANISLMDVTGDGIVNSRDERELRQYILGQNSTFSSEIINSITDVDTNIVSEGQPIETSVTAEMAAKATELGDALSVYNYLYNNMRSEFYFGSRKGAIGTFEQGSGNDTDLSSLLIAMLRYLGYEANYATSKAGFTEEQIKKWTNTDSAEIAHEIISSQKRNNQLVDINGETVYFYDYKYVQLVDSEKTYYLDVCFKEYEPQATIYDEIPDVSGIESIVNNLDFDILEDELLKAESVVQSLKEYGYYYSEKIVNKELSDLPSETFHIYDEDIEISTEISTEYSDMVAFWFDDLNVDDIEPLYYRAAELYKKNISISYKVSESSKEIASWLSAGEAFDTSTIFNLPSSIMQQSFSVVPEFRIDNEVIAIKKTPELTIGAEQVFNVAIKTGGEIKYYKEKLTAGQMCSIVFDTGLISSNELSESYLQILKDTGLINQKNGYTSELGLNDINVRLDENNVYTPEYFGGLLRFAGLMYSSQVDIFSNSLAEKKGIHNISVWRMAFIGYKPIVWNKVGPYETVDQKDGIYRTGRFYIDAQSNDALGISKKNDEAGLKAFYHCRGLISSELESTVLSQVFNVDALSATTIFRCANENSVPLITLSQDSDSKITDIDADEDDINRIQMEIEAGNIVISTKSKVRIGSWSGIGYIVFNENTGTYVYYISGGYKGGITADPVPLYYGIEVALDLALIAEGVAVMCGILAAMSTLALGPVSLLVFSAVMITFIAVDIIEQSILLGDYETGYDPNAGETIRKSLFVNSGLTLATFGIGKGAVKLGTVFSEARLNRTYGKTVVDNLKNFGFTSEEISGAVKKFKKLGINESAREMLLNNSKSMYLGDELLAAIAKSKENQRLLAELILKNGDDFSEALIKTNVLNEFCDFARLYGDVTVNVFVCDDKIIKTLSEMSDESVENYFKTIGYINEHRLGEKSDVLFSLYKAELRTTCRLLDETGSDADNVICQNVKKFRSGLKKQKKQSNVGYAQIDIEGVSKELYAFAYYDTVDEALERGVEIDTSRFPMAWKPAESSLEAFEVANSPNQKPYLRVVCTEYKILSEIDNQIGKNAEVKGKVVLFTEKACCESCSDVIAQFLDKHPNIDIEIIHNDGVMLIPD